MTETVPHHRLGEITFDDFFWSGEVTSNAFARFRYPEPWTGKIPFIIDGEAEEDPPTETLLKLAEETLNNLDLLVTSGLSALFEDFCGGPKKSGCWWSGNLKEIQECCSSKGCAAPHPVPSTATDLYQVMGSPSLHFQYRGYGYPAPCAIICFECAFEEEHGLGMLTDGKSILGIGFQMDVSPF